MTTTVGTPYGNAAWPTIRRAILRRDNHVCQIRGPNCKTTATHADHIVSWQDGGAWFDHANLRAACATCNSGRRRPIHPDQLGSAPPSRTW